MPVQEFADMIRMRRHELQLTQGHIAGQVGVHANYIGYLERGMRRPADSKVAAIGEALGLDKGELFAALHPLFRDVIRSTAATAELPPLPTALRALMEDEPLLAELDATAQEVQEMRWLYRFGEIASKEDYARVFRLIRDITR